MQYIAGLAACLPSRTVDAYRLLLAGTYGYWLASSGHRNTDSRRMWLAAPGNCWQCEYTVCTTLRGVVSRTFWLPATPQTTDDRLVARHWAWNCDGLVLIFKERRERRNWTELNTPFTRRSTHEALVELASSSESARRVLEVCFKFALRLL